jgi:hypothetical protein
MASHEIENRNALRDLIGGLTSWQTWTGEDLAGAKSRISWPEHVQMEFPFLVVVMLGGARTNMMGSDASANFRSSGKFGILVIDKVADETDLMASDTTFGTKFFGLLDDLVDNAHDGPIMISQISYGDNPYTVSAWNTAIAKDADSDGDDDEDTVEHKFFTGVFEITTGGA